MNDAATPAGDAEHGDTPSVVVVLLAGGLGARFGGSTPKQMVTLGGVPVLYHSCRVFDAHPAVTRIVIPTHAEWHREVAAVATSAIVETPHLLAPGGASRSESVLSGLQALDGLEDDAVVVVHDGARPLVPTDLVTRSIAALSGADAVLPVIPAIDPVVDVRGGQVNGFLPRDNVRRGQTPQVFRAGRLRTALTTLSEDRLRAIPTLFEALLEVDPTTRIRLVEGDERNLKITLPIDHLIAGQLLLHHGA